MTTAAWARANAESTTATVTRDGADSPILTGLPDALTGAVTVDDTVTGKPPTLALPAVLLAVAADISNEDVATVGHATRGACHDGTAGRLTGEGFTAETGTDFSFTCAAVPDDAAVAGVKGNATINDVTNNTATPIKPNRRYRRRRLGGNNDAGQTEPAIAILPVQRRPTVDVNI